MLLEDMRREQSETHLLAESGLYRYSLPSLGAAARQYRLPGLGLHTGTKPVGFAPPPAVGLKRALRHRAMHSYLKNFALGKPQVYRSRVVAAIWHGKAAQLSRIES